MVERYFDTVEVDGSIPSLPTINRPEEGKSTLFFPGKRRETLAESLLQDDRGNTIPEGGLRKRKTLAKTVLLLTK